MKSTLGRNNWGTKRVRARGVVGNTPYIRGERHLTEHVRIRKCGCRGEHRCTAATPETASFVHPVTWLILAEASTAPPSRVFRSPTSS